MQMYNSELTIHLVPSFVQALWASQLTKFGLHTVCWNPLYIKYWQGIKYQIPTSSTNSKWLTVTPKVDETWKNCTLIVLFKFWQITHIHEHLTKINIIWSVDIITTAYEILFTDQFCRFISISDLKLYFRLGVGDIITLTIKLLHKYVHLNSYFFSYFQMATLTTSTI
jgi:hypothetical protein